MSITIVARELVEGIYVVTARATLPSGRTDENIGAVSLEGLKGENRANALMKAETKAKRRVTLAICGLGLLDETEVVDIPPAAMNAMHAYDTVTAPPPALAEAPHPLAGDLPEGVVRIERIDSSPTKNKNVIRYRVTFSSGEFATTINSVLATTAQDYCEQGTPVRAEIETTQWGPNLKKITAADAPLPLYEPPPPVEDQPF